MNVRWASVVRIGCLAVRIVLIGALIAWASAAPLAWILRDGLGPDSVDTVGMAALAKFAAGWGTPALILALAILGLRLAERRLVGADPR